MYRSARISRQSARVKGWGRKGSLVSLSRFCGGAPERSSRAPTRRRRRRRRFMAKFNVVQKNRREWKQDRKRQAHGDPKTGKLKQRTAPVSVSGKRQRKLLRRLSRVRLVTPPPPTSFPLLVSFSRRSGMLCGSRGDFLFSLFLFGGIWCCRSRRRL